MTAVVISPTLPSSPEPLLQSSAFALSVPYAFLNTFLASLLVCTFARRWL